MANLLVLMELGQGTILPVSLEALGQARRLATALGATLYALLPLPEAPAYGEDDLIALCARHGADKVALLTDEGGRSEREMRFGTHGRTVLAACEQLPPALLLLGATRAARDLAPRVAAQLGAAYLPEGWLSADGACLSLRDRRGRPVLADDDGPDHVVVMTVPPGRYEQAGGDDEAEMVIVAAPQGQPDFVEVDEQVEPAWQIVGEGGALGARLGATVAPALVLGLGARVTEAPGALRVAVGPAADVDDSAHYALRTEQPEALLLALARAAGLEGK